jgi:hypothetical protein
VVYLLLRGSGRGRDTLRSENRRRNLGRPTTAKVSADTENISSIDAYVDGRPRMTLEVQDGSTRFDLPPDTHGSELRGFEGDELVALRRIEL